MLNVDKYFVKALTQNATVSTSVGGRIFDPARSSVDQEKDKLPYIIVVYEGGSMSDDSKDEICGEIDMATVSVLCVAEDRSKLATLTSAVENAIGSALNGGNIYEQSWNFRISDCVPSAGQVMYDPAKPCCFQQLTYQCSLV